MLKILLKKQLLELNQGFFTDRKTGKARSQTVSVLLLAGYFLLIFGVLGGMFFFVSMSLCAPLCEMGLGWLYFMMMGLVSLAIGIFGSVFNTYASLYDAKDNDLLLSLPVPVKSIIAVRLLGVYLMGLMFSAVVSVPAVIGYLLCVPVTAARVVGGVFFVLNISLLALALSCVLGYAVGKVSKKVKNKSFVTLLLSMGFLAAYYAVYFRAQEILQRILLNAVTVGGKIQHSAYPLYVAGRAGEGDMGSLLSVLGFLAVLLGVTWWVLSRSFLTIATASDRVEKREYRSRSVRVRSADRALLSRELGRFTASANYMMNCGLGVVGFLALAGALIIKGAEISAALLGVFGEEPDYIWLLLCSAMVFVTAMTDTAAASVSLEGKNLWIAQSLPVTAWQVLRSKLLLNLLLFALPFLVCFGVLVAVLQPGPVFSVLIFAFMMAYGLFFAELGLTVNLLKPMLSWTNEIVVIKQSMSVGISILGGMFFGVLLALLYLPLRGAVSAAGYLSLWVAVIILAALLLRRWLKKKGTRIYTELHT